MPCEVVSLRVDFCQNGCRCHGKGQNARKLKKHKNDHSRLLAEQKQHPHLVERDKLKKIGIGWTSIAAVAMETKKGGFKKKLDSFHQTS